MRRRLHRPRLPRPGRPAGRQPGRQRRDLERHLVPTGHRLRHRQQRRDPRLRRVLLRPARRLGGRDEASADLDPDTDTDAQAVLDPYADPDRQTDGHADVDPHQRGVDPPGERLPDGERDREVRRARARTTSAQYGQGNYNASAEEWGVNGYNYAQTMGVCTHDAWYVNVTTDNSKDDGAVKAYPSMRRIYWDYSTSGRQPAARVVVPTAEGRLRLQRPGVVLGLHLRHRVRRVAQRDRQRQRQRADDLDPQRRPDPVRDQGGLGDQAGRTHLGPVVGRQRPLPGVRADRHELHPAAGRWTCRTSQPTWVAGCRRTPGSGQISYGVETVSTGAVSRHWDFTKFTVDRQLI